MDPILCYQTQGFVHLRGVLEPGFLGRLKAAFDQVAAKHAGKWFAAGESATPAFNIPSILDQDDVFVDLVDLSTVFPLLVKILGPDIQLLIATARLFRPSSTFVPPWHSDLDGVLGIDPGQTLTFMAKIHFFPEDLTPEQGCLAFIPGSHRYPVGTPRPQIDYHQDSPLVQKIVPKAGDAVLFNPHIFHMCLDNSSPYVRKSLIYTYGHFWMKNSPSGVPHELERLATTLQRKQLFGISSDSASSYFSQSLPSESIRDEVDGFVKSGQRLLSKAKQLYLNKP